MSSSLNPRLAKINRNYSVEDIADLYGVHKTTVRNWLKQGLPVIDDCRPILILGRDLRDFVEMKRTARKRKCQPSEFFCLSCKRPSRPLGNLVDYVPLSLKTGRLQALCSECDGIMNRYCSLSKLKPIQAIFEVSIQGGGEHISKPGVSLLNSTSVQDKSSC